VGLAQIDTTVGDVEGNARKVLDGLTRGRALGCDLVAFPELTLTGYPPEDLLFKAAFVEASLRALADVARAARGVTAVVGVVERDGDLFNAAAVLHDGGVAGIHRKHLLPNYGVFDENRYFRAGTSVSVFTLGTACFAVNVCEDIWSPSGPTALQARAGARLVVTLNGSPYHAGKGHERERLVSARASEDGVALAYVNLVGGQDELVFDGASLVVDARGRVLARGRQFEEDFVVADLVLPPAAPSPAPDGVRRVVLAAAAPAERPPIAPRVEAPLEPVDEVWRALVLGTRDYAHKCGFAHAVVGLSGGIDSSLVLALAVEALGRERVTGVTMPSPYSSAGTRRDAQRVARNLGVELLRLPITPLFRAFRRALAKPFKGMKEDVAEENLQARIRGTLLMALSNKFGWLVLTTGNKSEVAVGYSTLYGDAAGGWAPLRDVPKTLVYALARGVNARARRAVIPASVLRRAPSAELRPGQTDTQTLPAYETLDAILERYVEEDRGVRELAAQGFDRAIVRKVARMVDAAEYKRRQAPVGVKITPRAFGRDWRLPIVNRFRE